MRLVVYGNPAPQGSKSYLGRTATGRGIIREASSKTAPWRADVKAACEHWIDLHPEFEPFDCPVSVRIVFTFLRPKSVKRLLRPFPTVAPDLGKLGRATEDAITASGLWRDDCLIVDSAQAKRYAGEDPDALDRAGCQIWIEPKLLDVIPLQRRRPLELEAS